MDLKRPHDIYRRFDHSLALLPNQGQVLSYIAMITVTGDRDRDRESTTCLTKTRHVAQIIVILIVALTFDILGAAALLHAVERGLQ